MGLQDRDYYHDQADEARKAGPAPVSNPYAEALKRADKRRSEPPSSWAPWIAAGCLALFVLVLCAAVWIAPR